MNRIVKTIGLLAGAYLVCSATVALAAEPSPRDVREMAKALLPHLGRPDAPGEVAAYHSHGTRVFNYGNPQSFCEDPETWRRNYGLFNWRHDLDGACTHCFIDGGKCPWNDFDHIMRQINWAYPTMDGVVGTLQLAGFREALNDVRYATKLRMRIEEVERTGCAADKEQAAAAAAWLKGLPLVYGGCSALGTPANIAVLILISYSYACSCSKTS